MKYAESVLTLFLSKKWHHTWDLVWLFECRLTNVEDLARATMKKLTQGMAEHNKTMAAAKTEEDKASVVSIYNFVGASTVGSVVSLAIIGYLMFTIISVVPAENEEAEYYYRVANLQ